MKSSPDDQTWQGLEPLHNPLDLPRLGQIYSGTAAFYDSVVAGRQAAAKLDALRRLDRRPGERFLEVGVGTAWAFQRVAEHGDGLAYGTDIALGMLEVARRRFGGPCPLFLADARALPLPDAGFDCLLNTYTFEVLPTADIPRVIDECLRVLRPGGRIAVVNLTDGETPDAAAMTQDWRRRYQDDPEAFGGARPLHLLPMLQARGFVNLSRTYVGPDWPSEVLLAHRPT